jgi:hypothetical protein
MANSEFVRKIRPGDIVLPEGYKIEVFVEGLTTPINLTFMDNGEFLYADAGITSGNGKVYKLVNKQPVLIADGFLTLKMILLIPARFLLSEYLVFQVK